MRVRDDDDGVVVETDAYRLTVHPTEPVATLADARGGTSMRLSLLTALDTDRGLDGTLARGATSVIEDGNTTRIGFDAESTVWQAKRVEFACTEDEVAFTTAVTGSGSLIGARLLGGWYTGNPRWGGGTFLSAWSARTLFSASPDDPRRLVQPASEPATIGVVGSAQPGRGHWFFTPAPMVFAATDRDTDDPDDPEAAPWSVLELRAGVSQATFTEVRYAPFMGGFSVELGYEGHTRVDGELVTPPLVIRFGSENPYAAVADHAERLRRHGVAPSVERRPVAWWTAPIFCGWGEQCRDGKLLGIHPTQRSRRELYDGWLGTLAAHGVVPGTVVIDDKWQTTYGRNEPDAERWPDLRGWIAERHAAAQRVLLWFKAWDPEGLPAEACVTDAAGRPVAADPTNATYQAILRESLHAMLGRDGLDADGLKVDFTAQTPSGPGLGAGGGVWGVALLHRLLELVHRFAKEAKADALVVTHTPSPLFADVTDMVRLNDLLRLDDPDPFAPAVAQMRHRARIAAAANPGLPIDTDDWCMPNKAEWRAYLEAKVDLGVPALYYATGIDHSLEPFDDDDYAAIRAAWDRWRARPVHGADR